MADQHQQQEPRPGDLSWRLSSHPITLLFFLSFRIGMLCLSIIFYVLTDLSIHHFQSSASPPLSLPPSLNTNCVSEIASPQPIPFFPSSPLSLLLHTPPLYSAQTPAHLISSISASLLVYLLGVRFSDNFILIFIITILLLAADFYYLKNIAGRRLVGLRWWNEVNTSSGDSHWVFESQDRSSSRSAAGADSGIGGVGVVQNATDKRYVLLRVCL